MNTNEITESWNAFDFAKNNNNNNKENTCSKLVDFHFLTINQQILKNSMQVNPVNGMHALPSEIVLNMNWKEKGIPLRYSRRVKWANPSGNTLRTPLTYKIASLDTFRSSSVFNDPISKWNGTPFLLVNVVFLFYTTIYLYNGRKETKNSLISRAKVSPTHLRKPMMQLINKLSD